MVTSNVRLATTEPAQVLIDVATPDGQGAGLMRTSAVKCENLHTLPQATPSLLEPKEPARAARAGSGLRFALRLGRGLQLTALHGGRCACLARHASILPTLWIMSPAAATVARTFS
jgi:hypothetical protein